MFVPSRSSFRLISLLFVLLFALAILPAQGQTPPEIPPSPEGPRAAAPAVAPASPEILGSSGTSFGFLRQYGTSRKAYVQDSDHFNDVGGLALDGDAIWVTDAWGLRALKFDSNGGFLRQVGDAGYRIFNGAQFDYVSDVAADSGGAIWTANGAAGQVTKFAADGSLLLAIGQSYSQGSGNDAFDRPYGVAVDAGGNLYVSDAGLWDDSGNHRVQVFDAAGTYLATIGETGVAGSDNAHLRRPRRMAIFGSQLFVADAGNHRIQIFDISTPAAPAHVATLGVSGVSGADNAHFNFPAGLFVNADRIFVADSNNNRVQIFNRTTRAYVATLGSGNRGDGNGDFDYPGDVAVDSGGRIYVADAYNKRVQLFSPSLVYVRTIGTTDESYWQPVYNHFNAPAGVAIGPDGSIHVLEGRGHRLLKFDAAGELQWEFGQAGKGGRNDSQLFFPEDVDVDADGTVIVADGDNRVKLISKDGDFEANLSTGFGSGPTQFDYPTGVAFGPDGRIYVADQNNHRVQIFNKNRVHIGELGFTNQPGNDNIHFRRPRDVDVDESGRLYVVDYGNQRVQVFSPGLAYLRTIGVTGECGSDHGHLCNPIAVSVDSLGRVFVADSWGWRVQVFDALGRYLTTIGRREGTNNPQVAGIATPAGGGVWLAEEINHRISVYGAPGSPWVQANVNGFVHPGNREFYTMEEFQGKLYAGTGVTSAMPGDVPRLYSSTNGHTWSGADPGLGLPYNYGVTDLEEFGGRLYAATLQYNWDTQTYSGAEVYRTANGTTWELSATGGFGHAENAQIGALADFAGFLYAGTYGYGAVDNFPAEIWRSATGNMGDWQRVVENGLGESENIFVRTLYVYGDGFYAGVSNYATGGEIWRAETGTDWERVVVNGFGKGSGYSTVNTMVNFEGMLYAGLNGTSGTQVWRCSVCSTPNWEQVPVPFDTPPQSRIGVMAVFDGALYYAVGNVQTGFEVWRTRDGETWQQVGREGFGDWASYYAQAHAFYPYNGALYLGVGNSINGAELWQYLDKQIALPLVGR